MHWLMQLCYFNFFLLGLDQNIRIFVPFTILKISFFSLFFFTPGIPRETVLNLSSRLNICTGNRPFANKRHSCWPIACMYFMKNMSMLLIWARLPHIYIWNNELKRAKDNMWTDRDTCVYFCQLSLLHQPAVTLVVQTRCTDVTSLWESERENTRYSWVTHAVSDDWFNLIFVWIYLPWTLNLEPLIYLLI